MRNRFQEFMYGRYGTDQLSRFLSIVALILLILSMFIHIPGFYIAAVAILVWSWFRILSRNTSKRYVENEKYLRIVSRIIGNFQNWGANWQQQKIYKFFVCPQCSQKVRVPRGKGKICITCPKCRTEFIKRT